MKLVYVLLTCDHGKLKLVSSALKKFKEIEEIHEVYGQFDIILKIICEDDDELKSFHQNKLQIIEGIHKTETLIVNDLLSD